LGEISDAINKKIQTAIESLEITSANPTHINTVIQINQIDNADIDALVAEGGQGVDAKREKKINLTIKKVEKFDKGNIGEINRLASNSFSNIMQFARNPAGFIFKAFIRKFARGVGVIALAVIIFEAVKVVIGELLKPGRLLDIRFKRDIRNEIIAFRKREDQQKLKQGFSSIIITSAPRLRGEQGAQAFNSLRAVAAGTTTVFNNIGMNPITVQTSGQSFSKGFGQNQPGATRR